MKVISISNQKGGVGKSTTVQAMGSGLRARGYSVLFVDLDPQGNLTYAMNADASNPTIFEVLTGGCGVQEAIKKVAQGDIIVATPRLAAVEKELPDIGKEYCLREHLKQIRKLYDFVIIDTPPALGVLTVNALTACDEVIIPSQADIFCLQGIGQLYSTIQAVSKYCNPTLSVKGILLTRFNERSLLYKDVANVIRDTADKCSTKVFKTTIREGMAIREAQARRENILQSKSNPAKDYDAFVDEYLGGI